MSVTTSDDRRIYRGYPIDQWRRSSIEMGCPDHVGRFKHGDKVRLSVAQEASYSGYGGRPSRLVETTEELEIASFIFAVTGRDRWLANLIVDRWEEGIAVELKKLVLVKRS